MNITITDRQLNNIISKVVGHLDVETKHAPIRVTETPGYWAFIQPITLSVRGKDPTILDCHLKLAADKARDIKNDKKQIRVWFMKEPGCTGTAMIIINGK